MKKSKIAVNPAPGSGTGRFAALSLIAATLALTYGPAMALGLGEAESRAQLGQPLSLAVPLRASPAEARKLNARLISMSSPGDMITDPATLSRSFRTSVSLDSRGQPLLTVTSLSRMTEPYVEFTVEIASGDSRLQRSFTILVDPPGFAPPASAPQVMIASAPAPAAAVAPLPAWRAAKPVATPAATEVAEKPRAHPRRAAAAAPVMVAATRATALGASGETIVVQRGECLNSISRRLARSSHLSADQIAQTIYASNVQAFGGSPDVIYAGAELSLHTLGTSSALAKAERAAPASSDAVSRVAPQPPPVESPPKAARLLTVQVSEPPPSATAAAKALQLRIDDAGLSTANVEPAALPNWLQPLSPVQSAQAGSPAAFPVGQIYTPPAADAPRSSTTALIVAALLSSVLTAGFMTLGFVLGRMNPEARA